MLQKLFNQWGLLPPKARLAIQVFAVGVASYLVNELRDGDVDDWGALQRAALTAVGYAIAALLTPLSPFVGVGKPEQVAVPSPPAVDNDSV